MKNEKLTLSEIDHRVVSARIAEKELFDFYGLKAIDHYVLLPDFGIKVRVSEIGSGKPLIIVPGNTGDVFPLASLLAELKGRRLIAINRPGGGLSEGMDHNTVDIRQFAVKTLDTVLETFNLDHVDIVAHSMGAHWSLWLAMDRPKRVRSLTLLGNPGNVMKGRLPFLLRLISKQPLNRIFFRILKPSVKVKALSPLRAMGHSAETIAALPKALGNCFYYFRKLPHYLISLTSLLENMAPKIDAKQLNQVSRPVLLLLGSKDGFASVDTGKSIVEATPHGELHVIPGAGHLPWFESCAECGRQIREFLAHIPE